MFKRRKILNYFSWVLVFQCLTPKLTLAKWSELLFCTQSFNTALDKLTGGKPIEFNNEIKISSPTTLDDGADVRVEISIALENVRSISLLVKNNPNPLSCQAILSEYCTPFLSTSIKMAESSDILALIETDEQFFFKEKHIKVQIPGFSS